MFLKIQASGLQFYQKGGSDTVVFLWICEIFKNIFFTETIRATASVTFRCLNRQLFNVFPFKNHIIWLAERPGNTETKKNCLVLAGIYLFKANNGNTETMCEICSKLTIKTTKTLFWRLNLWLLEILHYKELCNLINRKGGADQNDKNNCITWCFLKCLCQWKTPK